MPNRLQRYYGAGYSHFITTSCYRRMPLLGSPLIRDLFLRVLEQVRVRDRFVVVRYVVMPEHVHLLLGEPQRGNPSVVMQALKQGFARASAIPPPRRPGPESTVALASLARSPLHLAASLL
jgi:putative transposase